VGVKETISVNVRELRSKQNLTQVRLASLSGLDVRTINRLEKGAQNVTIELVERVALALAVSPAQLLVQHGADLNIAPGVIEELACLTRSMSTLSERMSRLYALVEAELPLDTRTTLPGK